MPYNEIRRDGNSRHGLDCPFNERNLPYDNDEDSD